MIKKRHHSPERKESKFSKKERLIAALSMPLAAVAIASCSSEVTIEMDHPAAQAQDVLNGKKSNSNEQQERRNITAEQATPSEFFSDQYFTDEERVNWAYGKLNMPSPNNPNVTLLEAAHIELSAKYNQPGGYQYVRELVSPSEHMTGDQIETLMSCIAHVLLTSDLSEEERVKMVAAEHDNSSPLLDKTIEFVKKRDTKRMGGLTGVNISSKNMQPIESPVFRHYVLKNGVYDPGGVPSKIVDVMETTSSDADRFQVIYKFVNGKPIFVKSISSKKSTFVDQEEIQNIPYEPR